MYSPRALPSSVSNVTEYGNSESPVATILNTASDPSVTVWVDGSRLMTIPSRHKISYPSSIAQMMWLTIIVYDSDRSHTISHFQSGLRSDGERERKQFSQLLDNAIVEDGNADCCLLLIWPNREWVWSTGEVGGSWKVLCCICWWEGKAFACVPAVPVDAVIVPVTGVGNIPDFWTVTCTTPADSSTSYPRGLIETSSAATKIDHSSPQTINYYYHYHCPQFLL